MDPYPHTTSLTASDLSPLSGLGLSRKRPWLGCRARSGPLVTDGAVILHADRVCEPDLVEELADREAEPLDTDRLERKWAVLTDERPPKYKAKLRGYAARLPYFRVLCEYVAVLSWRNYQEHWGADAKRLRLVRHLVGPCEMRVDGRAVVTFTDAEGRPAAVMKAYTRPVDVS